jgi:nucleoside-triphosphatase
VLSCKIFLTGKPGIGKSTVLRKLVEELKRRGLQVGGMTTQEAREHGVRVGFKVADILSGREGWLATVKEPTGPRVGKYHVNIEELESIGVQAIATALRDPQVKVVAIDELGPMELLSDAFKVAVRQSIASSKTIIGTIHYRANDPLLRDVRNSGDVRVVEVTEGNRATLHLQLAASIMDTQDQP